MAMSLSPDERCLATASLDSMNRLWYLKPADLIAEACRRLTRNLTPEEWRQYVGDEPTRQPARVCPVTHRAGRRNKRNKRLAPPGGVCEGGRAGLLGTAGDAGRSRASQAGTDSGDPGPSQRGASLFAGQLNPGIRSDPNQRAP